jgi:hypothetical protein
VSKVAEASRTLAVDANPLNTDADEFTDGEATDAEATDANP